MLFPLAATAAPGDSVETRLRLLEQKLESQKDDAKTEAGRVENRFLDRIGHLELTVSQQNSHVDQVLSQLNLSIAIGGIFIAVVALLGAWKAILVAKAEARDVLSESKEEINRAKVDVAKARAEVEALLKEVREGHGEAMTKIAELKAANISPEDLTKEQQATINAAAEKAASKPEADRSETDRWALAQQAMLAGDSGAAADHLDDADENQAKTWILRARIKLSQGDWRAAQVGGEQALRLSRETGNRVEEREALEIIESVQRAMGEWDDAKNTGKFAVQISREVASSDSCDRVDRKNLIISLRRFSQLCVLTGDFSEAQLHIGESVSECRKLLLSEPGDKDIMKIMGQCCEVSGSLYVRVKKYQEARRDLNEAMNIFNVLISDDKNNVDLMRMLSICWSRFGLISQKEDDWPQALKCAVEYGRLAEKLFGIDPLNVEWQASVAYALRDKANCDWKLGALELACDGYHSAIRQLELIDSSGKLSASARLLLDECRGYVDILSKNCN